MLLIVPCGAVLDISRFSLVGRNDKELLAISIRTVYIPMFYFDDCVYRSGCCAWCLHATVYQGHGIIQRQAHHLRAEQPHQQGWVHGRGGLHVRTALARFCFHNIIASVMTKDIWVCLFQTFCWERPVVRSTTKSIEMSYLTRVDTKSFSHGLKASVRCYFVSMGVR